MERQYRRGFVGVPRLPCTSRMIRSRQERGHGFQIVLQRLLYVALVVGLATAVVQNAAAQSASLVLSPTSLDVPEAGSASYTVKLATLAHGGRDGVDRRDGEHRPVAEQNESDVHDVELRHDAERAGVGGAGLGRVKRHRHP